MRQLAEIPQLGKVETCIAQGLYGFTGHNDFASPEIDLSLNRVFKKLALESAAGFFLSQAEIE